MNYNEIIKSNSTLLSMPYIYVATTLIELDNMELLKELNDDADRAFENSTS